MASKLNVPDGIDWPVSWRQRIGEITYGFILREMNTEEGPVTVTLSIDKRGERKVTGHPVIVSSAIGPWTVDLDRVFLPTSTGEDLLRPTEERIRSGDVIILALED